MYIQQITQLAHNIPDKQTNPFLGPFVNVTYGKCLKSSKRTTSLR